jgi:hypothetical protein
MSGGSDFAEDPIPQKMAVSIMNATMFCMASLKAYFLLLFPLSCASALEPQAVPRRLRQLACANFTGKKK